MESVPPPNPADADERKLRRELIWAFARFLIGLGALVGIVSLIGWRYRVELGHVATWFVARAGVPGMMTGVVMADGLMFPVPPQVYLLTGIAGGYSYAVSFVAVACGSLLGGCLAFSIGRLLGRAGFVEKRLQKPRMLLDRLIEKHGALGLVIASLFPISYSALCMATGAMRLPYRAYVVLGAVRVPKLFLSFLVITYAWHS